MSTIPTVDNAIVEVHSVELTADDEDDAVGVAACKWVLNRLLEVRIHLPQQRPGA